MNTDSLHQEELISGKNKNCFTFLNSIIAVWKCSFLCMYLDSVFRKINELKKFEELIIVAQGRNKNREKEEKYSASNIDYFHWRVIEFVIKLVSSETVN